MINPETYLKIVEIVKNHDDLESLEAFLYNRGKLVIDKKHLYENYTPSCIEKIKDALNKPRKNPLIFGFGGFKEQKDAEEQKNWKKPKKKKTNLVVIDNKEIKC